MDVIEIHSAKRTELIDITQDVERCIENAGTQQGICVVFCPHTTAGLTINENADPSVQRDITVSLNSLIPEHKGYTHSEGNSDSHIKTSLFGPSLTMIIEQAKLKLGTWQGVYFCEFDGPRHRKVWVKVISSQ